MNNRTPHIQMIERKLAKKAYPDIEAELKGVNDDTLIALLDSHSVKIGNTAAEIIGSRSGKDRVADAILSNEISTKRGKIRALFVLNRLGKKNARAKDAYLVLIRDKHLGVVSWALFGLVFWQDRSAIKEIRSAMERVPSDSDFHKEYARAVEALEKQDPFIFAPSFRDTGGVWDLDKQRSVSRPASD